MENNKIREVLLHDGWHYIRRGSFHLKDLNIDGNYCGGGFVFIEHDSGLKVVGAYKQIIALRGDE